MASSGKNPSIVPIRLSRRPPKVEAIGPHVLVIDDDDMVRRAVTRLLRRKYRVTELRDAESALALARDGIEFDAILCDLQLAGMSGREYVMHLIEVAPEQGRRVVILSGRPLRSMDDACLDAICSRFLEKPASHAEIDAMLSELVQRHARAA